MMAGITASSHGYHTLILDRMDRIGKKVLATGNGRCNLMNMTPLDYLGSQELAHSVLERVSPSSLYAFFRQMGLSMRTEPDGRVYPSSGKAATVLDLFRLHLRMNGVTVHVSEPVVQFRKVGDHFCVDTEKDHYTCRYVIVCCGGMAQPALGSNGSGYALLVALGHHVTPCFPCLTPLKTDLTKIRGLEGIRVRGSVRIMKGERTLHREEGEILFTSYGVSGICIMQCAQWAEKGTELELDFLSGLSMNNLEFMDLIRHRMDSWGDENCEQLFSGLFVRSLAAAILKDAGIPGDRPMKSLTERDIHHLHMAAGAFRIPVTGRKGFDMAQITGGGVEGSEFDPETLESRIIPGLYAAGEILDVHGMCGGYNLMFAFASGMLAGLCGHGGQAL